MSTSRAVARARTLSRVAVAVLANAIVWALAFGILAGISNAAAPAWFAGQPPLFLIGASLFAVVGAMFGVIVALDRSADASFKFGRVLRRFDAPRFRMAVCAVLGALAVLLERLWQSASPTMPWLIAGCVVGAFLGWFGWRWARLLQYA